MQNANNKSYNNKSNNANCYESRVVMYPVVPLWGLFRFRSEFSLTHSLSLYRLFWLLIFDCYRSLSFFCVLLFFFFACRYGIGILESCFVFIFQLFGTTSFFFLITQKFSLERIIPSVFLLYLPRTNVVRNFTLALLF